MHQVSDGFVSLTATQVEILLTDLNAARANGGPAFLRVGVDEDQVKWSVNRGIWTPPMGEQAF